ncbi:hypothetical protein [Polycladidibacter stylochi]|uniref:hypothetical protein n=1 Tax=Polycladidibacter stylochi TaxID=1807766 RepID=UPI000829C81F|nr:hypothetical protein [Pseudovibrio stylochi]
MGDYLTQIPSWWGVVFLVVFAMAGNRFRNTWKQRPKGWQLHCWLYAIITILSFSLMVFGSFDFSQNLTNVM